MKQITFKERLQIPRYDDREAVRMGKVAFDHEKCSGCTLCAKICPADVIVMTDKKPEMKTGVENECMACSDCMAICKEDSVKLVQVQKFSGFFKTIDRGDILKPRL